MFNNMDLWLVEGRDVLVLTGGTVEGPVTCGDACIIHNSNGTIEDMKREAFHPAVPVALIELVACVGVPEETRALTHLRTKCVIEVPPPARPEPLQLASLPSQFGHQ